MTSSAANLHNEIHGLLQTANYRLPDGAPLYATSYRPVRRHAREEIDVWPVQLHVGGQLPSLPLHLAQICRYVLVLRRAIRRRARGYDWWHETGVIFL